MVKRSKEWDANKFGILNPDFGVARLPVFRKPKSGSESSMHNFALSYLDVVHYYENIYGCCVQMSWSGF